MRKLITLLLAFGLFSLTTACSQQPAAPEAAKKPAVIEKPAPAAEKAKPAAEEASPPAEKAPAEEKTE